MPKALSIAIPCYNVEAYLEKGLSHYCIAGLEDSCEVIIVNDGSHDGTSAIANRFVAKNPRLFRLVEKPNGGHGSAINAGLAQAQGRYFRVIDGDDWVEGTALADLVERLQGLDCDLVVDERTEVEKVSGKATHYPIPGYVPTNKVCAFDDVCTRDDVGSFITIHSLVAKTAFLLNQGLQLLEHAFYVDYEYILKATAPARDVMFLRIPVYQYLVGNSAQSVSDANYVRRWDDHTRVTHEVLRFCEALAADPGVSDTRKAYAQHKANLLINTHYNISLIFDQDRKRGLARAKEFRAFLKKHHPDRAHDTETRYYQARFLHSIGFKSQKDLDLLTKRP
ncbi:MAG: glycosyltransferase [Coriobacteriaceae bacterium]|jgi:glycosyltransferase involved in cell wall biosynthesis|nr:glycosyltransferase [Coriobacteriaceae bacterium]